MTPHTLNQEVTARGGKWPVRIRIRLQGGQDVDGELDTIAPLPAPFRHVDDYYIGLNCGPGVRFSQVFPGLDDIIEILPAYEVTAGPGSVDVCPVCGDAGEWRAMAVVCRNGHGPFIGGCK